MIKRYETIFAMILIIALVIIIGNELRVKLYHSVQLEITFQNNTKDTAWLKIPDELPLQIYQSNGDLTCKVIRVNKDGTVSKWLRDYKIIASGVRKHRIISSGKHIIK